MNSAGNEFASANAADTIVGDGGIAIASAHSANTGLTFLTQQQAIALVTVSPPPASTSMILDENPNLSATFGSGANFQAQGELGDAHSPGGGGAETTASDVYLTLGSGFQDNVTLGLYGPVAHPDGVSGVTLAVAGNGMSLLDLNFTSAQAATSYFTDNPVSLGFNGGGGPLDVIISLSVTTNGSGGGFDAGFLLGHASTPSAEI